jgi:hypothetical protein
MKLKSVVIAVVVLAALGWLVRTALSLREAGETLADIESLIIHAAERSAPFDLESDLAVGRIEDESEDATDRQHVAASATSSAQQTVETPLYSKTGSGLHPVTGIAEAIFTQEIERGSNFSYLESTQDFGAHRPFVEKSRPDYSGDYASLAVRMVHAGIIAELTSMRGFDYFFVWVPPEKPGYYIFMTNESRTPVADLLGEFYSEDVQMEFDQVGYIKAVYKPLPSQLQ